MKYSPCIADNKAPYSRVILCGVMFAVSIMSLMLATANTPFGLALEERDIVPAQIVDVEVATYQDHYFLQHDFIGQVEAKQTSHVGFDILGVINHLAVDEGDYVKYGDVLARLDTARLMAKKREVSAQLERAISDVSFAESNYKRILSSYNANAVSAQDMDEALKSKQMRTAELKVAKAQLEHINIDIEKLSLTAPFDGVVIARESDEGTVVSAGQNIFTIQQLGGLNVRVGVTPNMLNQLRIGQQKQIITANKPLLTHVKSIVPRISQLRTADVILSIEETTGAIRAGEMVRLPLERRIQKTGFWVPLQALREGRRGLWSLYVIEPLSQEDKKGEILAATHSVSRRNVLVLNTQNGRAYVIGSVDEYEKFVTKGAHKLVPSQFVRLHAKSTGGTYEN